VKLIYTYILILLAITVHAQNITFQKVFDAGIGASSLRTFDGKQTIDGGYIVTGIGNFATNVERPFVAKFDCKAKLQWGKSFNTTGSWNNIFNKVIQTSDSGFVMLNNIGTFQAYNILVVRIDKNGNTIWRKIINNGIGNDMGQSIKQTRDGGFVICGATSSIGSDAGNANYSDAYIVKLSNTGTIVFAKTIGNAAAIDDAKDIAETLDGGFAFTGSYINKGCFNMLLGKLDAAGNVLFLKTYGDTLSRNGGYCISELKDSNLLLFGTTSLLNTSPSYNGDLDHWLLKTNALGDTIWSRMFNGTNNDGSDNSLSLCINNKNEIILGTETMSYPSTGFTPNKQVSHWFNANGSLLQSMAYNTTGSQYTRIHNALDGGYTLTGFTTNYSNVNFRTNIFKLDSALNSGCNDDNVTALTAVSNALFFVNTPAYTVATGSTISTSTVESSLAMADTTFCEFYPAINAAFTATENCVGLPIMFTSTTNAVLYKWYFDSTDSLVTSNNYTSYVFATAGIHTVTLVVTNGCEIDSVTNQVVVTATPNIQILQSPNPAIEGAPAVLSTNVNTSIYTWSTGATSPTISISQAGQYYVTVSVNGCIASDTINVNFNPNYDTTKVWFPNAFTPGVDVLNNYFNYKSTANVKLISFRIFDRWGTEVYNTTTHTSGWDGNYNGQAMAMDTYYYYAIFEKNKEQIAKRGDLILIR
jgi:gliding motility-associated-like protein